MRTTKLEPEVDSRHQEPPSLKYHWRHNYAADGPIHTKFGVPIQNEMLMSTGRESLNRKLDVNMAAVRFSKPEVVLTQPWIEICLRNLVHLEILTFWGHMHYETGTGSWFATSTVVILKISTTSSLCCQWSN